MTSRLTKEEVDRLFEKQAGSERANREFAEKNMDWIAQMKQWKEGRRNESAGARLEAREIQNYLDKKFRREYLEVLKQGVLEGRIQIHETPHGFKIDTPEDKVKEFVQNHPKFKAMQPAPDDLQKGWFLIGTVTNWEQERVNLVRKSLIDEFHAQNPSDLMLVDLAVSNYVRAMYATQVEMESIRYADNYRMEMYEIVMEGLQRYIHKCQNQLLRILTLLQARRRATNTFTYETYSRTDINLENWGKPLLLALAEITEKKEREIGIDEIKSAMTRYVQGLNIQSIPNSWIGYALNRFGFMEKIHVSDGNRYNIERTRVLTLLNEDLKA
jgi:hypothetical protein